MKRKLYHILLEKHSMIKWKRKIALVFVSIMILWLFASYVRSEIREWRFEGGHIAMQYDKSKWKLSYQEEKPYPIFCLEENENYILLLPIESDNNIFEGFHEELIIELYRYTDLINIHDGEKINPHERQDWRYYNYDLDYGSGKGKWLIFEKKLDNIKVIGAAQINRADDEMEEANLQEKVNEVLEILSTVSYSENAEIKRISKRNDLDQFYGWTIFASYISEDETEEIDRTKDCVPDKETARLIAESFLEERYPGWNDNEDYHYVADVIYIEQIYKWDISYYAQTSEGNMILDIGANVRIRRDNGTVTYFLPELY